MMIKRVKLEDIVIDPTIYPREQPNYAKIDEYKELIEDGVKFPPIVINKRTNHLIDGYHRFRAYKSLGVLEVEAEIIDIPEEFEWVEAIGRNTRHGLPLKRDEVKQTFKEHYLSTEGKIKPEEMARRLGVSKRTIYRWINEVSGKTGVEYEKATHKLSGEEVNKIIEMYKSGNYTRKEIAEKFNVTPDRVNQIVKLNEEVTNDTKENEIVKDKEKLMKTLKNMDFEVDDKNSDDEIVEEDDVIFTRDPEKIGKIFEQKFQDFMRVISDDTAVELFVEYASHRIAHYPLVIAESIRVIIPRLHDLIGKLLELERRSSNVN